MGEYDKVVADCDAAVERGRELRADYKMVARALTRKGNALVKKGDLPAAIDTFHKSLTEHRCSGTVTISYRSPSHSPEQGATHSCMSGRAVRACSACCMTGEQCASSIVLQECGHAGQAAGCGEGAEGAAGVGVRGHGQVQRGEGGRQRCLQGTKVSLLARCHASGVDWRHAQLHHQIAMVHKSDCSATPTNALFCRRQMGLGLCIGDRLPTLPAGTQRRCSTTQRP
jgi:hypothetical protein